jgi:beta-lactamase class A
MGRMRVAVLTAAAVLPLLVPTTAAAQTVQAYAAGGPGVLPDVALQEAARILGVAPARVSGPDRYATAAALSRHAQPDVAAFAYLAPAADPIAALVAAQAVGVRGGAILLVDRDRLPEPTADELARLGARRVFVLGGTDAVTEAVLDEVASITGRQPHRLDGADAAVLAAAVARHTHPAGADTVYVAAADAPADLLAAVPAVTAHRAALLLTARDALPAATADALAALRPSRIFAVGGSEAIGEAPLADIAARTDLRPARLRGPGRAGTADAVTRHAHPDGAATVYVASAARPETAATIATAIAANEAGLLLVDPRPPVRWSPRLDEAIAFARTRAGSVSFAAIGSDGRMAGHRAETRVPIASVLKVMFMTAHLRHAAGRDLTVSDHALLEPMIRRSANEPASQIANRLGPGPLQALAADAGMRDFAYTRPWGLTRTSARDQARFLYDLERHLPDRHRDTALRLLTEIVPEQRWGIGQVATPGWTVHFKGGWGSGSGAVDHQVALLRHPSGARAALAVMTTGNPSHAYGNETLREIFRRLLADLP